MKRLCIVLTALSSIIVVMDDCCMDKKDQKKAEVRLPNNILKLLHKHVADYRLLTKHGLDPNNICFNKWSAKRK